MQSAFRKLSPARADFETGTQKSFLPPIDHNLIVKCVCVLSCVKLFATPWTIARQAPPSMGFSRQEYWSGLPFASPGDLPDPGIEPGSPEFQADALTSEPPGKTVMSIT